MAFDFQAAEAAGYSKQDILKEMEKSGNVSFDFAGARKAGYSTDKIYEGIKTKLSQPKQDLPEIPDELPEVVAGPPEEEEADILIGEITAEPIGTPEGTTITDEEAVARGLPPLPHKNEKDSSMVDEIVGGAEAALTLATGATTGLVGSIVGQGAAATEQTKRRLMGDKLMTEAEYEAYTQEPATALTYEPKTKAGQEDIAAIGKELAVFNYMSPLAVETAGIANLAKTRLKMTGKTFAELNADKSISEVDAYLRTTQLKNLAGENIHGGGLSKEARLLVARHSNNPEITTDIIATVLDGIPKKDQAYILTRFLGDANLIKQAVRGDGDALAADLRADLTRGKIAIRKAIGNPDLPSAKLKWQDTEEYLQKSENSVVREASVINKAADAIIARFKPPTGTEGMVQLISDKGYGVAVQVKNMLSETNGKLNLLQSFGFRKELNELIRKSTGAEKSNLTIIKDSLDEFITKMATPEQKTRIDETISTYKTAIQNTEALEIIRKNTDANGIAVNWTKVHRDLEASGLRTPETVQAIRIAEAFSTKFGNDQRLLPAATTQGSSFDAGGVLGITGEIANVFKNHFAMWGNRADNIKIQKAIIKSIKNSKTNYDFIEAVKANKDIPEEFTKGIDEVLQIPYKAGARQTGDVNLEPIVTPINESIAPGK